MAARRDPPRAGGGSRRARGGHAQAADERAEAAGKRAEAAGGARGGCAQVALRSADVFVAVDDGLGMEQEELLRASAYVVGKELRQQ